MNKDKTILVSNLRESIKSIMKDEIQKLPQTLENLEPKDRINFIHKMMPYVFPKIDSIHHTEGEPNEMNLW